MLFQDQIHIHMAYGVLPFKLNIDAVPKRQGYTVDIYCILQFLGI